MIDLQESHGASFQEGEPTHEELLCCAVRNVNALCQALANNTALLRSEEAAQAALDLPTLSTERLAELCVHLDLLPDIGREMAGKLAEAVEHLAQLCARIRREVPKEEAERLFAKAGRAFAKILPLSTTQPNPIPNQPAS